MDPPANDNELRVASCGADGLPRIDLKLAGEPCDQNGGTVCDGASVCAPAQATCPDGSGSPNHDRRPGGTILRAFGAFWPVGPSANDPEAR